MSDTIIAKNQTGIALPLTQLSVPDRVIPASPAEIELTLWNTVDEIGVDEELQAYVAAGDVVLNDGTEDLTVDQQTIATQKYVDDAVASGGPGGGYDPKLFQKINSVGGQELNTSSASAITFNIELIPNAAYTSTSSTVTTFNESGVYEISYNVNWDSTSGSRRNVRVWMELNGSEVPMSRSASYTRNTNDDRANNTATFPVTVIAGDEIVFRSLQDGSSGTTSTIANQCGFTIKRLT